MSPRCCSPYRRPARGAWRHLLPALALFLAFAATARAGVGAAGATVPAEQDLGQALSAAIKESQVRHRALLLAAKAEVDPARRAEIRGQLSAEFDALYERLLAIQLDFATRRGDTALVAQLSGLIASQGRPAVPVPQDRPLPPAAAATANPAPVAR